MDSVTNIFRQISTSISPTTSASVITSELVEQVLTTVQSTISRTNSTEGNSQDPLFLNHATAARYLRAYSDAGKASKHMIATYNYRQLLHASTLGTSSDSCVTIWKELMKRNMFIGSLNDGDNPRSPVLILRKSTERFDKADFEAYRQGLFYILDCTAQLADRYLNNEETVEMDRQKGQWVIVLDMQGYSSKNSPPISVSLETMKIYQNHFPERAKRIIMLDTPKSFETLWMAVGRLVDARTREKFLWVSRIQGNSKLGDLIGRSVLECVDMGIEEGRRKGAEILVENKLLKNLNEAKNDDENICIK